MLDVWFCSERLQGTHLIIVSGSSNCFRKVSTQFHPTAANPAKPNKIRTSASRQKTFRSVSRARVSRFSIRPQKKRRRKRNNGKARRQFAYWALITFPISGVINHRAPIANWDAAHAATKTRLVAKFAGGRESFLRRSVARDTGALAKLITSRLLRHTRRRRLTTS